MAEIKIEKKSSPIWPWILLIILIVSGLIWYFSDNGSEMKTNDQEQFEDTTRYNNTLNYSNDLNQ